MIDYAIPIPPLRQPQWGELTPFPRRNFQWLDRALPLVSTPEPQVWSDLLGLSADPYYSAGAEALSVRGRLSASYLEYMTAWAYDPCRTRVEKLACSRLAHKPGSYLLDLLEEDQLPLIGLELRRRTYRSSGRQDALGYHALYCDPHSIGDGIGAIRRSLAQLTHDGASPSFIGTVLMVGIMALHPLEDGNGRLARIAFNKAIENLTPTGLYFPLYELGQASAGNWLTTLREVQLFNNWSPITRFLRKSVHLFLPATY